MGGRWQQMLKGFSKDFQMDFQKDFQRTFKRIFNGCSKGFSKDVFARLCKIILCEQKTRESINIFSRVSEKAYCFLSNNCIFCGCGRIVKPIFYFFLRDNSYTSQIANTGGGSQDHGNRNYGTRHKRKLNTNLLGTILLSWCPL